MSDQLRAGQPRLPLSNIQNKSKGLLENSKGNKSAKIQNFSVEEDNINFKKDCVLPDSHEKLSEEEENVANYHYTENLKKALNEACEVNEKLRKRCETLEEENKELKEELEKCSTAILELAEHYEFCVSNHSNNLNTNNQSK